MTPACSQDVPLRHVPPAMDPKDSADVQTRREDPEPVCPLLPAAAFGAVPQMRVQRRVGDARRRLLVVDAGGYGGMSLTAVHPAMVSGTPRARGTGGRRA